MTKPNPDAFAALVAAYDAAHPISRIAVRSSAMADGWVFSQLKKRRDYLLTLARRCGLGDAALVAMSDPLDAQLDALEARLRPALIASMRV